MPVTNFPIATTNSRDELHNGRATNLRGGRIVGFNNRNFAVRKRWLDKWCPAFEEFGAFEGKEVCFRDIDKCDVLIIHGDDRSRLANWVKTARSHCPSVILIVVMTVAMSDTIVNLLCKGADEVFDISTNYLEASAKMERLSSRFFSEQSYKNIINITSEISDEIIRNEVVIKNPTLTQGVLLNSLYCAVNKVVPYSILLRQIGKLRTNSNLGLLKVHISHIRSILGSRWKIVNFTNEGYQLKSLIDLPPEP